MNKSFFIVISGPTGVGKSDLAQSLGVHMPLAIINADVGQMYTPLTIGTAKPNWQESALEECFFDILDTPCLYTAMEYRKQVVPLINKIYQQEQIPALVGGSLFYIYSLFFPQQEIPHINQIVVDAKQGWAELHAIDPERAQEIHLHDRYRIERALALYHATGKKPSTFKPGYNPPGHFLFIWCTRERQELYDRINKRVKQMIDNGWIDEVKALQSTPWEPFLRTKKIIGYDDVLDYLQKGGSKQELINRIAQKTRHYAKRQLIFWKRMNKQLIDGIQQHNDDVSTIQEANLTYLNLDLYIKQLLKDIENKVKMVDNNEL